MDSTPEISVFKCVTGRQNIKQLRRQLGLNATKEANGGKQTGGGIPKASGKAGATDASTTFTQEHDETIVKMKAENKTWQEIATAVHKGKQDVQNRFKVINANKEGGGDGGGAGEKPAGGDGAKGKPGDKKQQGAKKDGGGKGNTLTGLSDENMKTLSDIVTRHNQNRWLGIASEFWDEVGIRINHEDVKEKFK